MCVHGDGGAASGGLRRVRDVVRFRVRVRARIRVRVKVL